MKYVILFLIFSLIIFMPIQTWDGLQKNATTDTTIEQFIADQIALHEADPTAHLGVGESLEAHKTADVIDHPMFSVVADKFSPSVPAFQTLFENTDSWEKHGNVLSALLLLRVGAYGNQVGDSYAYNESIRFNEDDSDYSALDNLLQTKFYLSSNYNVGDIYFGMGVGDSYTSFPNALMFKIIDTTIYSGFSNDGTVSWISHGTISTNKYHTMSVITSKQYQEAYFYIDEVLIRTIDLTVMSEPYFSTFGVYFHKTGGTTNSQFKFLQFQFLLWNTGNV